MKRSLLVSLCLLLCLCLAAGSTIAYLTDTDSDVNVMTLGNVDIEQLEYERVTEDGHEYTNDAWVSTGEEDKYGYTPDQLEEFEADKPMMPSVFADGSIKWDDRVPGHQQSWQNIVSDAGNPAPGSSLLFDDSVKNVVDKFVFVENTGKSDAYVRTWFAFEQGTMDAERWGEVVRTNGDTTHWTWETVATDVEIDGTEYVIACATYLGPTSDPNGILAPGAITYPSLLQVYLAPEATNEDVEALDANGDGKYNIMVVSQAIQAMGFEDAETALNEGFIEGVDVAEFDEYETAALSWFGEAIEDYENEQEEEEEHTCWDGSADTSWYNDTDTEFILTTPEQLAGLADLVDGGNTFDGKTIKLGADLNMGCLQCYTEETRPSFDPIGIGYNTVFKGTFDGQGHTIKDLYQNGWSLGLDYSTEGGGLFASVVDATFENLTLENPEIVMECIDMGALVGYSYGNTSYKDITIKGGVVANYNRYTGGVVGEVNGTQTFDNVDVIGTTISALWGTYDCACGGIIGGKWGNATVTMKDCDVSAELDVFNDACSNYQYYQYRLCGMLIGNSEEVNDGKASASYLTATNCTVTYGDWANYTYCESESYGKGSYAAPDEWKYKRVQAGYATEGVDPSHTHDTDEDHETLFAFDQLFGGDKGVAGGKTHTGVTVNYN